MDVLRSRSRSAVGRSRAGLCVGLLLIVRLVSASLAITGVCGVHRGAEYALSSSVAYVLAYHTLFRTDSLQRCRSCRPEHRAVSILRFNISASAASATSTSMFSLTTFLLDERVCLARSKCVRSRSVNRVSFGRSLIETKTASK
uniref:Putative secreted protein n=1 Tax=Ixodes ricinus TaxID=34613 RepID=A0A6B0UVG1_IXORI